MLCLKDEPNEKIELAGKKMNSFKVFTSDG